MRRKITNSMLDRQRPKRAETATESFLWVPNGPNYGVTSIYQEMRKLQTLGEGDE
jgi:hypothetical protein